MARDLGEQVPRVPCGIPIRKFRLGESKFSFNLLIREQFLILCTIDVNTNKVTMKTEDNKMRLGNKNGILMGNKNNNCKRYL